MWAKFSQGLRAEDGEECHRKMRSLSTTPHDLEPNIGAAMFFLDSFPFHVFYS